jgi:hypothetical protein
MLQILIGKHDAFLHMKVVKLTNKKNKLIYK